MRTGALLVAVNGTDSSAFERVSSEDRRSFGLPHPTPSPDLAPYVFEDRHEGGLPRMSLRVLEGR
jgi:hypothetical protein